MRRCHRRRVPKAPIANRDQERLVTANVSPLFSPLWAVFRKSSRGGGNHKKHKRHKILCFLCLLWFLPFSAAFAFGLAVGKRDVQWITFLVEEPQHTGIALAGNSAHHDE